MSNFVKVTLMTYDSGEHTFKPIEPIILNIGAINSIYKIIKDNYYKVDTYLGRPVYVIRTVASRSDYYEISAEDAKKIFDIIGVSL